MDWKCVKETSGFPLRAIRGHGHRTYQRPPFRMAIKEVAKGVYLVEMRIVENRWSGFEVTSYGTSRHNVVEL